MDYWRRTWTCPFLKWDGEKAIGCEGCKLTFRSRGDTKKYLLTYCGAENPGWKECSIAKALLLKYEEEEKKK